MHSTLPMPTRPLELDDLSDRSPTRASKSNVLSWALPSGTSARRDPAIRRVLAQAGVELQPHPQTPSQSPWPSQSQPVDTPLPQRPARRVALQVIADADGLAHGYELLYRDARRTDASGIVNGMQATCEVLAAAVLDLGLPRRARGLSFFVNVDRDTLMSPVVEAIRPGWGVVELLETIVATPEVVERVRQLRQHGLRFALDDVDTLDDSRWALIDQVEVVKFDWKCVKPTELPQMLAKARSHGVRVLAEKVETAADVAAARGLGIDLLQGHAIARPDLIVAPGLPATSALAVRRARLLLEHGPSNESIATALAFDPATVWRIWQVADLDGARADTPDRPHLISDVVADLPRPLLQAWLTILQVADAGQIDIAWTYAGLVKARLMKVMARRVAPQDLVLADEAYLLGLLEHFRTTLGIAMRDPDLGVRAGKRLESALRERRGLLGALLEFAQSHYVQPTGWLPAALAAIPGLTRSLSTIFQEAHQWARERSETASVLRRVSGSPGVVDSSRIPLTDLAFDATGARHHRPSNRRMT